MVDGLTFGRTGLPSETPSVRSKFSESVQSGPVHLSGPVVSLWTSQIVEELQQIVTAENNTKLEREDPSVDVFVHVQLAVEQQERNFHENELFDAQQQGAQS